MNRGDTKMINTFKELHNRFDAIAHKKHTIKSFSNGAVGELFEKLMIGRIVGGQRGADFTNINTEAKVHYSSNTQVTLFSYRGKGIAPRDVTERRGKSHAKMGNGIVEKNGKFCITHNGKTLCEWSVSDLEARITEKMTNLALIKATKTGNKVTYDKMTVCRKLIPSRFIESIRKGEVKIETRSSKNIAQFRTNYSVIEGWFEVLH